MDPTSAYVTQEVQAALHIGIRKVEIGGQRYELDLLSQVLDVRGSQLSVFADGRAQSSERWLADSNGEQHPYQIFTVRKSIRIEEAGDLRVGPVFLRANYPTALRRGFFGSREVARARKETARADAIVVTVKTPPEQGRPPDYTGSVGTYRMNVVARPTQIEQGKPVTLTITITGKPLEGIAGPDLTRNAELASRFDFTTDELVGDVEKGHKIFRKAIFPRQPGEQTVPPLSWSFFDPDLERYTTLRSEPIAIQVAPPTSDSGDLVVLDDDPHRNGTTLKVLAGGISPNYTLPDLVLAEQTLVFTRPWAIALGFPPAVWLIALVSVRRRNRLRGDVGLARRHRAARRAHTAMHGTKGDSQDAWPRLARVLTDYLADRFNLPPGELTPPEAARVLLDHGAEEQLATGVADFLEHCGAARYAPGAVQSLTPAEAAQRIRTWIRRIERTTR